MVQVTAGNGPKNQVNTISLYLLELISPKLDLVCIWAWGHTGQVYGSKVKVTAGEGIIYGSKVKVTAGEGITIDH